MSDDHDLHRHDDDGFTGHDAIRRRAKHLFVKAAKAYCRNEALPADRKLTGTDDTLHRRMMAAFNVWRSAC